MAHWPKYLWQELGARPEYWPALGLGRAMEMLAYTIDFLRLVYECTGGRGQKCGKVTNYGGVPVCVIGCIECNLQ